jgi:hypothetical protein
MPETLTCLAKINADDGVGYPARSKTESPWRTLSRACLADRDLLTFVPVERLTSNARKLLKRAR